MKVDMILNCTNTEGDSFKTNIGYINPVPLQSTDSAVVNAFKVKCKNFAIALNSLTSNDLVTISLQTLEDITTRTEGGE